MKSSISFADAYGLGLIASKTVGVNRNKIVQHLESAAAKRIGRVIITESSSAKAKNSAKKSFKPAKKARAR